MTGSLRQENTVEENDYRWPFGIISTFFLFTLFFSLIFVFSFPMKKIFNHFLSTALQSQPKCKMDYSDYSFGAFPPSINFSDIAIPKGCLLHKQKAFNLDTLKLGFGGINFSPLSLVLNIGAGLKKTELNIKVASNQKSQVIKIIHQKVDLEELTQLVKKINPMIPSLQGTGHINLDVSFENKKLKNLNAFELNSSNFLFPSQAVSLLFLPDLNFQKLDIKVVGKKEKLNIKKFIIGNATSPLELNVSGNLLANFISFKNSKIDLKINLREGEKIKQEIPLLSSYLGDYQLEGQEPGNYGFQIVGSIQSYKQTKL